MNTSWSVFHAKFNPEEIKKYVPSDPGVYTLWMRLKDRKWKCFYCGKAADLELRLMDHLLNKTGALYIGNQKTSYVWGFAWTEVFSEREQDGIVKFLYDHYRPEWNTVDPGGYPIEVPLPVIW